MNTEVDADVAPLFSSCCWLHLEGDVACHRNKFGAPGVACGCVLWWDFTRLEGGLAR